MLIPATSPRTQRIPAIGNLCQVMFDESGGKKMGQFAFGPIRMLDAAAHSSFNDHSFITLSAVDLSTSINYVLLLCFSSDNLATSFCFDSVIFCDFA